MGAQFVVETESGTIDALGVVPVREVALLPATLSLPVSNGAAGDYGAKGAVGRYRGYRRLAKGY